jgi:hypothetical protein
VLTDIATVIAINGLALTLIALGAGVVACRPRPRAGSKSTAFLTPAHGGE